MVFDPLVISYEEIVGLFFDDPRVPSSFYGEQDPQYQVAVWAMNDQQISVAKDIARAVGKHDVPIFDGRLTAWHEGEENHQNFFGSRNPRFDPLAR